MMIIILMSLNKFSQFCSAETYQSHTKSICQEEKYSANGETHKQKWQEIIQSTHKKQSNLSHDEQIILNAIAKHENVPRKKPEFQVI
jgi:hypothetical protein